MMARKLIAGALVSIGLLAILNWCCGFIVRDTYYHLDVVDVTTAASSGTVFLPNQHKRLLFPGLKPYRVTINNLGLRGPDLPLTKTPGTFRVLCLGDSFTFGLFSDDEDSYPWQLQQLLDPTLQHVQILNAGVGGTTISDQLDYLQRRGWALEPDAIILQVCANDVHEIVQNTVSCYRKVTEATPLRGLAALIRRVKRTNLYRLFVMGEVHWMYIHDVMKMKDARLRRILWTKSRALDDVLYTREKEGSPIVVEANAARWQVNWEEYFKSLASFLAVTRERGIPVIVVTIPSARATLKVTPPLYSHRIETFLAARGVTYLDPLPVFHQCAGDPLGLFNNPPRDFHLSRIGYRLIAEQLAPVILRVRTRTAQPSRNGRQG